MKISTNLLVVKIAFDLDNPIKVGRLAHKDKKIYFEYDAEFLKTGLNLSPFKLNFSSNLQKINPFLFEGLPGVFNDSLPDGWGRLLIDRRLRLSNMDLAKINALDRLCFVGESGFGALIYEPHYENINIKYDLNIDQISERTREVLNSNVSDHVDELSVMNGSSAGARPKIVIGFDSEKNAIKAFDEGFEESYEPWLLKFANSQDGLDAGAIEYVYSLMAHKAGVEMAKTHLFKSNRSAGFFASKRFDRQENKRIHMHTACGLLHTDFKVPCMDYQDLIKASYVLSGDIRDIEKIYRLAVFNVLGHNRDDHSKNFSFLMDEHAKWCFSPAYDLTFAYGPGGEQSTMVLGKGNQIKVSDLLKLGKEAGLENNKCKIIIEQTKDALSTWIVLAKQYGVSSNNIKLISSKLF